MFQQDQKGFLGTLEAENAHEGEMPGIGKFVTFWVGIWEREERTPNMTLMKEIRRQLNEKVNYVNELSITFEKVKKKVTKGKGCTSYNQSKKHQQEHSQNTKKITEYTNLVANWKNCATTKNLEDEKNYCPIKCLNTSHKAITGFAAKYMKKQTMENKI